MQDNTMAGGIACHWVAVPDASGGTHLEARWEAVAATAAQPHAA